MKQKVDDFLQLMEFHISAFVRDICRFDKSLFSSTGNTILKNVTEVHKFVYVFNKALKSESFGEKGKNVSYLKAGLLNGMGLLDEIFHYVCRLYRRDYNKTFFTDAYDFINAELGKKDKTEEPLQELLLDFIKEFPPRAVYTKKQTAEEWLSDIDEASGVANKFLALEELLLLRLANENPAFEPFFILFNDEALRNNKRYSLFWRSFKAFSEQQKPFGPENTGLISMLKKPVDFSPFSIKGQLQYIISHWKDFLGEWLKLVFSGLDLIAEEEKQGWFATQGGQVETNVYTFESLLEEYERFTKDHDWMPNVTLMAKSTLVWLDQLSRKYSREISRLDQIPDEELEFLSRAGFNALWLIGIWERSKASSRIKQICGNPDAAASAYSLNSYEIADDLGGWSALENLRSRCAHYGIRLAADMVPNHTAMDSHWVVERPNLFMQTRELPFPAYSFNGENLCHDSRVAVYLEDHYYSRQDCAVVFKRLDKLTGDVTYIYHGNDGTGLPWNDTAQLDFLNPETREAVIQEIINVARNFKIIRLDAAMVLAKKHIQRLWYPQAGSGGAIASRSRFTLTNEEFNQKIPEEFWREVVDRCKKEVPDTLLLAEAFWMMEGYFVRTLGMHRVYNSAFMNMLKREENEKYRATIKNTLEFDPEVLKRYVNFMNNPDEDTAIAQFGSGDKYFGVCTMMVAMPGLPMFGHGQIEGFEEKYGMEYRRAYYNEQPKQELVERHKREIFPLLRKRYIFSGVENFFLFDFWNNGLVNENVFAWSNYCGGQRSLIFYNNAYERAYGWILVSAGYAVKKSGGEKVIEQKSLMNALQLTDEKDYFTIFHEQRSNRMFIRENTELAHSGFYAALDGFQCQVFWDIYEVKDNERQAYRKVCKALDGCGCANIEDKVKELEFAELYTALERVLSPEYFETLVRFSQFRDKSNGKANRSEIDFARDIADFIEKFTPAMENYIRTAIDFKQKVDAAQAVISKSALTGNPQVSTIMPAFLRLLQRLIALASGTFLPSADLTPSEVNFLKLIENTFYQNREKVVMSGAAVILYTVRNIITESGTGADARNLTQYWLFDKKIAEILSHQGLNYNQTLTSFQMLTNFFVLEDIRPKTQATRAAHVLRKWLNEPYFQNFLRINEWKGECWFNKEQAEYLAFLSMVLKLHVNAETSDDNDSRLYDIRFYSALYEELLIKLAASQYSVDKLSKTIKDEIETADAKNNTKIEASAVKE